MKLRVVKGDRHNEHCWQFRHSAGRMSVGRDTRRPEQKQQFGAEQRHTAVLSFGQVALRVCNCLSRSKLMSRVWERLEDLVAPSKTSTSPSQSIDTLLCVNVRNSKMLKIK